MDRVAAPRPALTSRAAALLLALLLGLPLVLGPTVPASAQGLGAPTVSGSHLRGEAPDYATERFGDPWDYAQTSDIQTDPGPTINVERIAVADGRLQVTFTGTGHVHAIWPGFPGGLRLGRDGPANPVDTTRYSLLSMRIRSASDTAGSVVWQTCPEITAGCEGQAGFPVQGSGWQTVTVDLRQGSGQPWAGAVQALRVAIAGGGSYEIDWMRLHAPADPATISWTSADLGRGGELLWDADADPSNNTDDNPAWGVVASAEGLTGAATFDVAAHPAGTYRFAVRSRGSTSPWSAPLVIEAAPRIRILDPDITGGEDFATAVLGNPWDFSGPDDVAHMENVAGATFADGRMHGTNDVAGHNPRDPFIVMSGLGDIDANRYHRFTVTTSYEGPFDLSWDPGGGTHGRISWRQDGHHLWQQTAEVVTYSDIDTYTVVLGSDPRSAVMEADLGQPGWGTGARTHELRYDLNEDIGPKRWTIDEIRLAADDESFGSFDVTWVDDAHQPGTTISLFADRDPSGFDGQPIATGITTSSGVNTYRWDTHDLAPGTYWVHAQATSPGGVATSRTYATGPVQVRTPTTFGDIEPPGLRLAGADRIATSIELSRAAFPGTADTAIIARAGDFPDALAAAPLAAAIGAPVLLNSAPALSPLVRTELERIQVQRVILLGGTAAQSPAVEQELRSFVGTVDRAAGEDRFHTASIVAERAVEEWRIRGHQAGPPLIALGSRFEDALAAASLAGHARRPLLLAGAEEPTRWTLRTLDRLGATSVTVVGGRGLVQPALLDRLRQQVGTVDELAGADHVETAVLAARAAIAAGARRDIIVVASADAFPDALAAGPAVIAQGGVLLLTPRTALASATRAFLSEGPVSSLRVAGGEAAVSRSVGAELARTASFAGG